MRRRGFPYAYAALLALVYALLSAREIRESDALWHAELGRTVLRRSFVLGLRAWTRGRSLAPMVDTPASGQDVAPALVRCDHPRARRRVA